MPEFFCNLTDAATLLTHFREHTVGSDHAPVALRADWQSQLPFHGGFGLMNLHGIPKPAYRAFELLHQLGTEALLVDGSHETVDAWVVRKDQTLTVLVTNHAGPRHPIKAEQVHVVLRNAPGKCYAYVERIDEAHANPKRVWREMGEPEYLSAGEVERLQEASRMWKEPQACERVKDDLYLDIILPPHAVAAVTVEFTPENGFGGART